MSSKLSRKTSSTSARASHLGRLQVAQGRTPGAQVRGGRGCQHRRRPGRAAPSLPAPRVPSAPLVTCGLVPISLAPNPAALTSVPDSALWKSLHITPKARHRRHSTFPPPTPFTNGADATARQTSPRVRVRTVPGRGGEAGACAIGCAGATAASSSCDVRLPRPPWRSPVSPWRPGRGGGDSWCFALLPCCKLWFVIITLGKTDLMYLICLTFKNTCTAQAGPFVRSRVKSLRLCVRFLVNSGKKEKYAIFKRILKIYRSCGFIKLLFEVGRRIT